MEKTTEGLTIGQISDYNSAALINMRINNLWTDAHNHKRAGKFLDWNGDLDSVWCELAGDVEKEKDDNKEYIRLNGEIGKLNPILNWASQGGFNKTTITQLDKKTKQYKALMEKEVFLRRLQNKQGKGTKYGDEESWE